MLQEGLHRLGIDSKPLQRVRWLRWILPVAAIVIAAYIGLNAPTTQVIGRSGYEIFLLLIVMAIAGALVLYRLEIGVLAIVISSFLVRFSLPTGSATQIPASMVIALFVIGVWIVSLLLRGRIQLVRGAYLAPTLLFMLISLISVPYSWIILRPDLFGRGGAGRSGLSFSFVQLGGVALMVLLPAVMLITANVLRDVKWFKVIFAIVVIVAIPELLQRVGVLGFGLGSFLLSTGASYALWVVALSVSQALLNDTLQRWQRAGLLALAGIWLYYGAELGATWFSGWLPAFAALIFLAIVRSRWLFVAIVAAAIFLFALRPDHYINYVWNDAVNSDSNRFEIWQVIILDLTLTKTNILLGAGPAGYLPFYESYYPGHAWVSHNNYVDIFAETGLIGFSTFLWMLWATFRVGWRQRKWMPTGFQRAMNMGILSGFVGTLLAMGLGDWHIPFVYNIGVPGFDVAVYGWLLIGAMFALGHMNDPNNASGDPAHT
jgi:hypothetical protein